VYTALIDAADRGHDKCVQLLIDNGADVYKHDKDKDIALNIAIDNGHKTCVNLLRNVTRRRSALPIFRNASKTGVSYSREPIFFAVRIPRNRCHSLS
jgi:ankyrin repeat protein